jgi:hypothetical protein
MNLKVFNPPTNIYRLTKRYLSQSTAVMSTNTAYVEREVSKVCPKFGTCNIILFLTWISGNKSKQQPSQTNN